MATRLQAIMGHLIDPTAVGSVVTVAITSTLFVGIPSKMVPDYGQKSSMIEWTQERAKLVLCKVETALKTSQDDLSPMIREAYNKAVQGAAMIQGFTKDHPKYSLVIALGIVAITAPLLINLLGFTKLGPTAGGL